MVFNQFINKLTLELNNPLPGYNSQIKMAPQHRLPIITAEKKQSIKKSAVLILLHPNKKDIHISLIKRITDGSKHSGQIALPGGKFEKEDKNLKKTAIRETEEEIGVSSQDIQVIGSLTSLFIPVSNFCVLPVIGSVNYKPRFRKSPDEVDTIYSVKLQDVVDAYTVCKTFEINNETITAPFYILNGIEIWGATAMILSEFIDVLKQIN